MDHDFQALDEDRKPAGSPPRAASSINRQHFDIARLLVYLSRSFLQNKENGFDKKKKNRRDEAFLRGNYFTKTPVSFDPPIP